jgi:hypothetical protein
MHTEQQLFVGLAHARPTERNEDEELRGALGAYFYAVALADDGPAFVERVRVELEEIDFELADVGDVRPFDEALRAERLAADLLELANCAASENTTRFSAFYLYEEETTETDEIDLAVEYKQEPRHIIELALMYGGLVGVRRTPDPLDELQGFVVGLGGGWLLLHVCTKDAVLDGYVAMPVDDVFDAWTVDAEETVAERALRLRGEHPSPLPELDLDSVRSLIEYADASYPLVCVYVERELPDVCLIGRVERFDEDDFTLATITPGARWQGEETFAYDAVTRLAFGGRYEEALARVAEADPG